MSSKNQVLKLYKSLIRESQKFSAYNFRLYAVRRVQDAFRENRALTDVEIINNKLSDAHRNLEIIKRQARISQMYQADKLVIENVSKKKLQN